VRRSPGRHRLARRHQAALDEDPPHACVPGSDLLELLDHSLLFALSLLLPLEAESGRDRVDAVQGRLAFLRTEPLRDHLVRDELRGAVTRVEPG
jgi:hypothetical protein